MAVRDAPVLCEAIAILSAKDAIEPVPPADMKHIFTSHIFFLLWFVFEGRAYQYKVLPFGLFLSPHVFTKVAEGTLAPLREVGIRTLNYLDDWPSCGNSCVITGIWCSSTLAGWVSGQLGKEQAFPHADDLFSQYGIGLIEYDGVSHQ